MIAAFALAGLLWPLAPGTPDDKVVVRAEAPSGVVEITAKRLAAFANAHPELSPRASAEALVEFELLAAEAKAKGLHDSKSVAEAGRSEMARQYLMGAFEASLTAPKLPEKYVRRSYEQNKGRFVRPELRYAEHVLVGVMPEGAKRPQPPTGALRAKGEALIGRIAAEMQAKPPESREAFIERAESYKAEAEAMGLVVRPERLGPHPREGRYVKAFTDATFKITDPPGITPVFESEFGLHVAYVYQADPALNRSYEDAEAEIREKIVDSVRGFELKRIIEARGRAVGAAVDYGPIAPPPALEGEP